MLTKYYKARVGLSKVIELNVAAESEDGAFKLAREKAKLGNPGLRVDDVSLTFLDEASFSRGDRVNHEKFGSGEVLELNRVAPVGKVQGYRVCVKFDSGDIKSLCVPPGILDKLEA